MNERAVLLGEWLRYYAESKHLGWSDERAAQHADVLTFGLVNGGPHGSNGR